MKRRIPRGSSVLILALLALAPAIVYSQKPAGEAPPAVEQAPGWIRARVAELVDAKDLERAADDDAVGWMVKQRDNAARRVLQEALRQYQTGVPGVHPVSLQERTIEAAHRLGECRLEAARTKEERVAVREQLFALALEQASVTRIAVGIGRSSQIEVDRASFESLDAQIKLARERAREN